MAETATSKSPTRPAAKPAAAQKSAEKPSAKPPQKPTEVGAEGEVVIRDEAFSTSWYWFTFVVAFLSFWVLLIYYNGSAAFYIVIPFWIAIALAAGLSIWSFAGLMTRYRVFQRIGASAGRMRDRAEATEESTDEEVVYRENIVVRLFKMIGRLAALLFLFVWNTLLRIIYIIEITILRAIILSYDILYYVTYAAWSIVFWAVRTALRIVRWALRVVWRILRILTRLPIARKIWDEKLMPKIMGWWNGKMALRKERADKKRDTKRRLIAAKGLDPDKWEADQKARHHFPLPHPHDARKGLRARIDERQRLDYNRRDRWAAFRRNQPIPPKLHSERRKRKLEEKQKEKDERKAGKGDKKKERKGETRDEDTSQDEERRAADEEIGKAEKKGKGEKPAKPKAKAKASAADE